MQGYSLLPIQLGQRLRVQIQLFNGGGGGARTHMSLTVREFSKLLGYQLPNSTGGTNNTNIKMNWTMKGNTVASC